MFRDVIVIGSGLGGLVSAAMLAKQGKKVTVLEQHYLSGGYATSFKRRKLEFEVSLHLMGDLGEGGTLRKILEELGVLETVDFYEVDSLYKVVFPDKSIIALSGNVQDYKQQLINIFPQEKNGIETFVQTFIKIREEIMYITERNNSGQTINLFQDAPTLISYQNDTLKIMLSKFINSEELQTIISQYWMYFGLPPSQMSAVFYAYVWTEYHIYGGYYPHRRSQSLSDALKNIILKNGGEVLVRQEVTKILHNDNRVYGVETAKKQQLIADCIISNVNPKHTFGDLIGYEFLPKRYKEKVKRQVPSLSCIQAYVYLDIDLPEVYGEKNHEIFVNEYYDIEKAYYEVQNLCVETAPYCITIYENINPEYHERGMTTLSLFQLSSYENWLTLGKEEYQKKKKEVTEILLGRLNIQYPGVIKHVKYAELSTPHTNERYTKNTNGAIYGAAQTIHQSLHRRLPQTTPIKNLYLAGAWTQPGGGYSGTIWSGYNLAKKILLEESGGGAHVTSR
ncbi:phytoene desaturase family protein [Metabacillus fastidiosus]|uniref:phytoene desaturase family protein n=1 Tax=Metabacillus fastidiosus TaxID=1458 RepID=UPI003D2B65BE